MPKVSEEFFLISSATLILMPTPRQYFGSMIRSKKYNRFEPTCFLCNLSRSINDCRLKLYL
ncbi:hypothetical protein D8780_15275 [Notoacmeibacter ruber]|uniref:Uncharacterized protein n=1 Tax=Notoacmeibacter ruber TaxID=2670375 RepID=A0A3L7J621_9HYPH|nr:hypothetical protein D8780_15275 [Notoacmeibacter ruber]